MPVILHPAGRNIETSRHIGQADSNQPINLDSSCRLLLLLHARSCTSLYRFTAVFFPAFFFFFPFSLSLSVLFHLANPMSALTISAVPAYMLLLLHAERCHQFAQFIIRVRLA